MNFLGSYTIKGVGKANVDKKILHCDFTISPTAFTAKFGQYMEDLPSEANIKLQQAVASKKDIKIDKSYADDLDVFLQKIKDVAEQETADTSMGFGAGEKEEEEEAEGLKERGATSEKIQYKSKGSSSSEIDTYDTKTGKKAGGIYLKDGNSSGELVPLTLTEQVQATYDFNATAPQKKSLKTSGIFKIANKSAHNRIWDVDVTFKNLDNVEIDDHLYFKSIEPQVETPLSIL